MACVSVQADDYDVAAEIAAMTAGRTDIGAVVTFSGLCRDDGGTLEALEIEHYPGMAEGEIARVCAEAEARWPLQGCRVIHRYRRHPARRDHRPRRHGLGASRRGLRGGRLPDGLSQERGAVLEAQPPPRRGRSAPTGSRPKRPTTTALDRWL